MNYKDTQKAREIIKVFTQYVEDFIDEAAIEYQRMINIASIDIIEEVVRLTPYYQHSLHLTAYHGGKFRFRENLWKKIAEDLSVAENMKKEFNSPTFDKYHDEVEILIFRKI